MNKKLRTLAALPVIAVIGAGCGSSTPDETGAASSTGSVANASSAANTGSVGHTGTEIAKRSGHKDKAGSLPSAGTSGSVRASAPARELPRPVRSSPSSAGLPGSAPSPAGHLPAQPPRTRQ